MSARDVILFNLPGSQAEIAERTSLRLATVCDWLAVLTARHEAYILFWETQNRGGKPIAIYAAGAAPSAPRPPLTRNAIYSKRSRTRSALQ